MRITREILEKRLKVQEDYICQNDEVLFETEITRLALETILNRGKIKVLALVDGVRIIDPNDPVATMLECVVFGGDATKFVVGTYVVIQIRDEESL